MSERRAALLWVALGALGSCALLPELILPASVALVLGLLRLLNAETKCKQHNALHVSALAAVALALICALACAGVRLDWICNGILFGPSLALLALACAAARLAQERGLGQLRHWFLASGWLCLAWFGAVWIRSPAFGFLGLVAGIALCALLLQLRERELAAGTR